MSSKLPVEFVERHGANIPGTVSLKVPTGAKWRVEVKRKEDEFWFGEGLFQFAQSLGVKNAYFLTFDYDDTLHDEFLVVAFGLSAVEIQYPAPLASVSKRPKLEKDEDSANMGLRKRSEETPALFRNYPTKRYQDKELECIRSVDERAQTDHTTISKGAFGREIILNNERRIQCVIQGRRFNIASTEQAIARARAFKVEEPVCIIAMRPAYVWERSNRDIPPKCQLVFPLCFTEAYFNLENKYVELRTNGGKTWSVEYRVVKDEVKSFFTYGWKQFVVDNGLHSGDVCLFELIKGAENALKVVIFRSMYEEQDSKQLS